MITQEQVTQGLAEAERALTADPAHQTARQWMFSAYWGLADLYYNHGDFDGHIGLLQSIAELSERVAKATGLDEYPQRFISWEGTCGLGHLAQSLDMHVKARQLGLKPSIPTILLADPSVVANRHYLNYFAPYFERVVTKPEAIQMLVPFGGARGYFGALEDHYVVTKAQGRWQAYCEAAWNIETEWNALGRHSLLQLSTDDKTRGYAWLKCQGVPPGSWFAVLHVRESNNWDHANGRNVALSDYFPAIGEIVERGGWVVRIGNPQMTPLPPMPNVIDYAHSPDRADWLDVFLLGAAKFMLGTQSGPVEAAQTFGVPCLTTNWQFGFRRGYEVDLQIFKRYKINGKLLSMEQALRQRFAFIESPAMFVPGVEVVPNTPDEIRELVEEWLDGNAPTDADAARLAVLDAMQREVMAGHKHTPNGYCQVGRRWLAKVEADER